MRRLHDPTEANRRQRAAARLRQLAERESEPDDSPVAAVMSRAAMFLLGSLLLAMGSGLLYVAFRRIPAEFMKGLTALAAVVAVAFFLLPGAALLFAAVLPERLSRPVVKTLMNVMAKTVEALPPAH